MPPFLNDLLSRLFPQWYRTTETHDKEDIPERAPEPRLTNDGKPTREYLVDLIIEQFEESIQAQSSRFRLLFNGFFRIIIRKDLSGFYQPTFQVTVSDAMTGFCQVINKHKEKYSDFNMPLTHCRFEFNIQTEENMRLNFGDDCEIFVESFFIDPRDVESVEAPGAGRVMTVINKGGKIERPRAIASGLLGGVTEVNTSTFEAIFNLADPKAIVATEKKDDKKETDNPKEEVASVPVMTLTADNFFFLKGQKDVTTFKMESDRLKVGGRNSAQEIDGVPVLRCDSEEIMNPHFEIRRSGKAFYINPEKEVDVNGKTIAAKSYFELPNSATVKLNKKYVIKISIKD